MDRKQAEQSVALHFTRVMNATPSRWGVLCDVALCAAASSILFVVGLLLVGRGPTGYRLLGPVATVSLLPVALTLGASLVLHSSRERVLDWLVSLPFPVQNLNALLAGVGDTLEVCFQELPPGASLPARAELQALLDAVSEDIVLLGERAEERIVEIRLGVIDSRRNPHASNYRRWRRLQEVVGRVLVPLNQKLPIAKVHVV